MIEEITLRRTLRPEWLGGNISYHNPVNVSLYCDGGIMDVPLALLAADSAVIRQMCDGPEQLKKHITLVGIDILSLEEVTHYAVGSRVSGRDSFTSQGFRM